MCHNNITSCGTAPHVDHHAARQRPLCVHSVSCRLWHTHEPATSDVSRSPHPHYLCGVAVHKTTISACAVSDVRCVRHGTGTRETETDVRTIKCLNLKELEHILYIYYTILCKILSVNLANKNPEKYSKNSHAFLK